MSLSIGRDCLAAARGRCPPNATFQPPTANVGARIGPCFSGFVNEPRSPTGRLNY
jgi:hypothetical protein